jgi:hypothetical protein
MEPEYQRSSTKGPADEEEPKSKSRKSPLEQCVDILEAEDLNQFDHQLQTNFELLGEDDVRSLLNDTISKGWLEGTRRLLERGANPNSIYFTVLTGCDSVAMFQLLDEFGMDCSTKDWSILK